MSNQTNEAEPSGASAGSQPVAYAVEFAGRGAPFLLAFDKGKAMNEAGGVGVVVPLYRHPQPALTDDEREALWCAVCDYNQMARRHDAPTPSQIGAALRGLFERLG